MKNKRTAPYKFDIKRESQSFKKAYFNELNRLRLSYRIAALREKRGLSQAELARKVGTTQAGISRLENPNYQKYSLSTLEKVAIALGTRLKVDFEEASAA
jgi:ribosome-binding protein aMBF1 (putative translation factor)